ncbi:MAG: hypothetical protein KME12_14940 [Trichocoleus desertorum ATA4-8-CV12]|jgi:hypothetical protein|nr:hypothetical protein [Trichocoleus desertorum ATA4-8-CV12]
MHEAKYSEGKLYIGFVATLKTVQFLGYLAVLSAGIIVGSQSDKPVYGVVFSIVLSIVICFFIYISTQGFIAIIDLLSHIEINSRNIATSQERIIDALDYIEENTGTLFDSNNE